MFRMIQTELYKLGKRRMTWILLLVMAAFFCLIFFATYGITSSPPERMPETVISSIRTSLQFPDAFNMIFSSAGNILTLLLIILVASSIGNEYGWGTVRQIMARKGIRYYFVVSKLVSFIVVAVIGLIIAFIFGFILALIISNMIGSTDWSFMTASYVGGLFEDFGWTLFTLLPYILMAAFFAFLGRSAIAGIGGGLGFYFIEAIAVGIFSQAGGWLAEIPGYLVSPNIEALLPANVFSQGSFMSATVTPSILHASVTLSVYCVVFIVIALALFQKRDLTV